MRTRPGSAAGAWLLSALLALALPAASGASEAPYVVTVQDPGVIGSVFFTPDGRYFIHHTNDALQLWTRDGVLLREFDTGGYGQVSEPGFLPGGEAFLAALGGGYARPVLFRFDLSGERRKLFELPYSSSNLAIVRVLPDGRSCLVVPHAPDPDNPIRRYELSGRLVESYDTGSYRFSTGFGMRDFRLAPDGRHFAFAYEDGIYLFASDSAALPRAWKHPYDASKYYKPEIDWLDFSADGRRLLSHLHDLRTWSLEGELLSTTNTEKCLDLVGMQAATGIMAGYSYSALRPEAVLLDPSGSRLSSFQVDTLASNGSLNVYGFFARASPDLERFVFTLENQNSVLIYDRLGHLIKERRTLSPPIAVLRGERGTGRFWTATQGYLFQRDLSGAVGAAFDSLYFRKSFGIAADNKALVTVSDSPDNRAQLRDMREGELIDQFTIPWSTPEFQQSADGALLLLYGGAIADLGNKRIFAPETDFPYDQYPYYRVGRRLHPDSKTLIVSASDYQKPSLTRLYDFEGRRLREFPFGSPMIEVNPATGAYALSQGNSRGLELYDREGRSIASREASLSIQSMRFSPDGRYLAVLGSLYGVGGAIDLYDGSGAPLRGLSEPDIVRNATALEFLPGTPVLMVVNRGKLILVNVETGDYATSLSDGRDWIIYTPDGYFDASTNAASFALMVRGLEYYGLEQTAIEKNRPDIIMRRLGAPEDERLLYFETLHRRRAEKLGQGAKAGVQPRPPKAEITSWKAEGAELRMDFRLRGEGAELASYQVFVNDVALFPDGGKKARGPQFEGGETVTLTDGENKVELSCRDRSGIESLRQILRVDYRAPREEKPDLYYIGLGVSRYKDERLTLRYADKDVKDLGALFAGMGQAYASVHRLVLTDEECTVAAIKNAKSFLDAAKPRDTLILAIAGHGLHDRDEAATYYYLTYETRLEDLAGSAAPFDLIEDILDGVAPRTKLFLMDTCESGEVEEEGLLEATKLAAEQGSAARAVQESRGIAVVASAPKPQRPWLQDRNRYIYNPLNRRTGAIVFSSSKGGEFSYESDDLRNGFFTYQILQALQGKVKASEGYVGFDELKAYVSGEVARMSSQQQHPTVDRNNYYMKLSLPQAMLEPRHFGPVAAVAWARNGGELISAGSDGNILVWDDSGERQPHALYGRADGMLSVELSPDGSTVAVGYNDGRVLLIDAGDGSERMRLAGHTVRVASIAFSPDGRRLATVDSISGGELRIWDLETGKLERELRPEGANPPDVLHATFSADGSSVLVATRSTTVKAYRVADGKVARSFAGPSVNGAGSVTAAYVPGDREIAALWEDGKVYFWDARMGRRTRGIAFKDGERPIESMDISDDGRFLAGVGEGVLGLWDLATGAELWRLDDPGLRVADAAFAPGGARILAGCEDGSLLILGSADGTRLARLGAGD